MQEELNEAKKALQEWNDIMKVSSVRVTGILEGWEEKQASSMYSMKV